MQKNLIYQVWDGDLRPGCTYSEKLFRYYANMIDADYRLDLNPNIASKHVKGKDGTRKKRDGADESFGIRGVCRRAFGEQ